MRWIIPTCMAMLALTSRTAPAQTESLTVSATVRDPVSAGLSGALRVTHPSRGEIEVTAPLRVDGGTAAIIRLQGADGSALGCRRGATTAVPGAATTRGRRVDAVLLCRASGAGGALPLTLVVTANA